MFAGNSHAETVNTVADLRSNKRIAAYVVSRPMQEIFFRLGVEQDRKFELQLDCKSKFNVKILSIIILLPIDFPDDKQNPTKGAWIIRYELSRCGEAKIYNALFSMNGDGGDPIFRAYYPGSTIAHTVLVEDAMVSAHSYAMIHSEVKGCKNADIFDMRVTQQPHDFREGEKEYKGVWNENWTFKVCDRTIGVPITFIPDVGGGGTSFAIGLR